MAQYEKRVVAFIDILGFKDKVKESENDSSVLNSIDSLLQYLFAWETGQANKWDCKFIQNESEVQKNKTAYGVDRIYCTCFSDSLAVSMPYDLLTVIQHFSTFVSNLAHICSKFMQAGIPIRGGITVGDLIHTEKGLYGPAMNEAVELEKNVVYPRIILSKDLIGRLQFSSNPVHPYNKFLTRFDDGCVGVHSMKYFEYQANTYLNELTRARKDLLENLDKHLCNPYVFEKYKWLTEEFNKKCDAGLKINMDLTDGGKKPYNIFYKEVNP
jgi:hypothetical protein